MRYIESEILELKSILTDDIKREVVAFSNTKGGTIYVGIEDDGNVIGLNNTSDKVCEQIASMLHDGIKPDVTMLVEIKVEYIDNKDVAVVNIQRGTKRPYYLTDKGLKPSGVYLRLGNTSVPATETNIRNMIMETDGTSYEEIRSFNQELTFQTAEAVFMENTLEFEAAQKKTLGIMDCDGIYTNLGLLISDQCRHSIKAAIFKGNNKDEFITRKEFTGSLFKQVEDVYSFIDMANQQHSTFEGLYRIDEREYSEAAIREALFNAVIHRDYSFSGSILISIFSDRMELVSLGGLAPGLELEDIYEGVSQSRNPLLANIFYHLKYVEAYGTGIRKIQKECRARGVIAEFNATNAAFKTVLPNSTGNTAQPPQVVKEAGMEGDILQYIRQHTVASRSEIQAAFGLKQTRCGVILLSLEKQGLITKEGAGRNTVYKRKL